MRRNFWIQVQNYMRKAKFRRKVRNILAMLAVVTVFTTTYALILPAITLENSVPLAGFDANEGKTPEELAAEAERQAAAEAAAAEGSGNGGVDADPAAFVGPADSSGEGGQNPAGDGETPPPTPPESVEVSGEVSGEFSSDNTDYPSIEGFTMNAEGRVFDASGNEIDPTKLSEAQRQSLLAALQNRTAEEALANYHMNGAGQVLDANEQPVDISGLSPETLKALEQKYIDEVLSLYHMDKDGTILDSLNQPQDPATFSAAALVALREKSRSDASVSADEDSEKEPGSHDLSLYKMQDNGRIVSEDGAEIPAERFSEEELASLKKAWSERVLAEYTIDENGDVKNAQGETIDSSAFPEELLLALRQKAADSSEALPYALKMYMDQDLVIKDGFTHQPVSEEKLNELSAQLRDILYGFEVNYDARLEVKDRYTAGLRAQGLDAQAESVANSAAPMAEVGRQQALAANAQQIAAGEAALNAEVQVELAQAKEQAASAEAAQGGQNSLDSQPITLEDLAGQQALAADQNGQQALGSAPQPMGAGQQPMRAPIVPDPPTGLKPDNNTLTQNPPQPYYYYTDKNNLNQSSFVRISLLPFVGQNIPGFSYTYPTGAAAVMQLSFSNADDSFTNDTIRVYIKADKATDDPTSYSKPGSFEIRGKTFEAKQVTNPQGEGVLYYYDITGIEEGATGQASRSFAYPNGTLGGNTTIWAEKLPGKNPDPPAYSAAPKADAKYVNVPHVIEPRQQQLSKNGGRPNFKEDSSNVCYVSDLNFTVQNTIIGQRRYYDDFGEIGYLHTEEHPDTVVDVLTLPQGMRLRNDLDSTVLQGIKRTQLRSADDIPKNVQGIPVYIAYPGSLLTVTLNGREIMLAYFEESRQNELNYEYAASLTGDGRLKIEAKAWYKEPRVADRSALWNFAMPLRYHLGDELIRLDAKPTIGDPEKQITNEADYTLTLFNLELQQSHAQTTVALKPVSPHLSIEKKRNPAIRPHYFGDPAGWVVTAENDSNYPYNHLSVLKDMLSPNLYLSKNDLYELFTAKPAFNGQGSPTVTIDAATLVYTPQAVAIPNANGNGLLEKNAQTHGDQTPYLGMEKIDKDQADSNVSLRITRVDENLVIECRDSSDNLISNKTVPLKELKGITNSGSFDFDTNPAKSYIVTHDAQYRISWPYQTGTPATNYSFFPGEKHSYLVPTTVKSSFMLLREDNILSYPVDTVDVDNRIDGQFEQVGSPSEDHSVSNVEAWFSDADREAFIEKELSDNNTPGVGQFTIHARYAGQGAPDVLTISDHLQESFVSLLAEKNKNPGKTFGSEITIDGVVYGVVTQPGIYVIGRDKDSGASLTAEISKNAEDGTWLMKWHFDKADVGSNFNKSVQIYTYVDPKGEHAGTAYINEVWMNDHATHRLYNSVPFGPVNSFKKYIVKSEVNRWNPQPQEDRLSRSLHLNGGDKVLYRLEISAKKGTKINKGDIYDTLPQAPANFSWTLTGQPNVEFYGKTCSPSGSVTFANDFNQIEVTEKNASERQLLKWTGTDPLLTFDENGTAYFYIRLTFPSDKDIWDSYIQNFSGSGLNNIFHVYQGEDRVYHQLGNEQLVFINKSCIGQQIQKKTRNNKLYETFLHRYGEVEKDELYWNSPSYYKVLAGHHPLDTSDSLNKFLEDRFSYVTYQVILYNPSRTERMYLSDLQDTMPSGFRFLRLSTALDKQHYDVFWYSGNFTFSRVYKVGDTGSNNSFTGMLKYDGENVLDSYPAAYQLQSDKYPVRSFTVNAEEQNENQLVFKLSNLEDKNGTKFYDDHKKLWYLPPGGGLSFSYQAWVGDYSKSEDRSENSIRMKYIPAFDEAVPGYPDGSKIVVQAANNSYNRVPHPGSAELEESGQDTYLLSRVDLRREPTQIGIAKRYIGTYENNSIKPITNGSRDAVDGDDYYIPGEQLRFQVDLKHQSGVVQDWTFTETMEKPYGFDEIKFYPQGYDPKDTFNNSSDLFYTFKIREKKDGENFEVTLHRPPLAFEDQATWNSQETKTLRDGGRVRFGGQEKKGKTPIFDFSIKSITINRVDYQQIQITPEKGYFGYSYNLGFIYGDQYVAVPYTGVINKYPKFDVSTSVHAAEDASKKLYENVARLTPSNPIIDEPIAGIYDSGNGEVGSEGGPSIYDGVHVPVFGNSATGSDKTVLQLNKDHTIFKDKNNKENRATAGTIDFRFSNDGADSIQLPDESSPLRYILRVKNLNQGEYIDDLVLADNLPQPNDSLSWSNMTPRQSKFKVNFCDPANDLKVRVYKYKDNGTPETDTAGNPIYTELNNTQYRLQFSDTIYFNRQPDFSQINDPAWYDQVKESSRSFRIWLKETGAPDGETNPPYQNALIPPNAIVEVSFDAEIDSDYSPASEAQTAWNNFGYRYHMHGEDPENYLEAQPPKVGVTLPRSSYPSLKKQRFSGDSAYAIDPLEGKKDYLFMAVYSTTSSRLNDELQKENNLFMNLEGSRYDDLSTKFKQAQRYIYPYEYQFYRVPIGVGQSSGTVVMKPEKQQDGSLKGVDFSKSMPYSDVYLMEVINPLSGKPYIVDSEGIIREDQLTRPYGLSSNLDSNQFSFGKFRDTNYPAATIKGSALPLSSEISFTADNRGLPWNINLRKTDGHMTTDQATGLTTPDALKGAIFALYSPLQNEAMALEQVQALQSQYNFKEPLQSVYSDPKTGKIFYLTALSDGKKLGSAQPFNPNPAQAGLSGCDWGLGSSSSDSYKTQKGFVRNSGMLEPTARFEHLQANQYILLEKRAPIGYMIKNQEAILLERSTYYSDSADILPRGNQAADTETWPAQSNADAWALVSNEEYEGGIMPETGGIGRWPFILGGLFFLLVAGTGLWARRRQAALETAPQSRR